MQFYQRIKSLREDKDKYQKEIAGHLNITQQQYQLYESGKRALPIDLLKELCIYYDVTADYILELTDTPYKLTDRK